MSRSQIVLAVGVRGGDFSTVSPSRPMESSRWPAEVVKTAKVSRRMPGGVEQVSTIGQIRFLCDQSSRIGELAEGSNDGIGRVNFGEVGSPLMVYRFFICFPSIKPANTPVPRMARPNYHVASSDIASD